jgi:hypothetical protein
MPPPRLLRSQLQVEIVHPRLHPLLLHHLGEGVAFAPFCSTNHFEGLPLSHGWFLELLYSDVKSQTDLALQ